MTKRWHVGQRVLVRYVEGERVTAAFPFRVVRDTDDLVALFIRDGTTGKYLLPVTTNGTGEPESRPVGDWTWYRDMLRLMFPGRPYSIWLLWNVDPRRFRCWYVNLEEPFTRTAIGLDTSDHELDIVVNPDLTWRWKDEDMLLEKVKAGTFSAEQASEIRAAGESVIELIERVRPPFCDGWESWTPDPSWGPLSLSDEWDAMKKRVS